MATCLFVLRGRDVLHYVIADAVATCWFVRGGNYVLALVY